MSSARVSQILENHYRFSIQDFSLQSKLEFIRSQKSSILQTHEDQLMNHQERTIKL